MRPALRGSMREAADHAREAEREWARQAQAHPRAAGLVSDIEARGLLKDRRPYDAWCNCLDRMLDYRDITEDEEREMRQRLGL